MEIMDTLRRNPELMRRTRFVSLEFGLAIDEQTYRVSVQPNAVSVLPPPQTETELPFVIAASRTTWQEYAASEPRPGFNDVIAMAESGNGTIRGNNLLPFFSNLLLVKGVVAAFFKEDAAW